MNKCITHEKEKTNVFFNIDPDTGAEIYINICTECDRERCLKEINEKIDVLLVETKHTINCDTK